MTDKKNTWKKGQSGNPKGRPKGTTITDEQLSKILSKNTKECIEEVMALVRDSKSENVKLKAALAIIAQDKAMRDYINKKLGIESPKKEVEEKPLQSAPKVAARRIG